MANTVVPDFGGLASQQNTANNAATNLTNQANRPNQYNALGSLTWSQDPSGNWTQSSNLNAPTQGLFDSAMAGQQNLSGQIGQGLDYSSLGQMPQVGGYNQQVINSWNALQQPGLDQQAEAQRARAAAMGITLGSNANNDVERNIGNQWTDASNKAILAGYTQGNTEFGQALQARQQGASELQNKYSAALSGNTNLGATMKGLDPNSWATKVPASAAYIPQTIYGAAQDTFNAQRQNENADIAAKNATISAGTGLASSVLGSPTATNAIGSAASNLWSGAQNLYNSWFGGSGFNSGGYTGGMDNGLLNNDVYGGSGSGWNDWSLFGSGGD